MPSETFHHTARTDAPPETAWAALQRAETWAAIGGVEGVSDVRHDERGILRSYRFVARVGGTAYQGRAETEHIEEPRAMTVNITSDHLDGRIEVTLSGDGAGSEVAVRLTARSRGLLTGLAFPAIASAIGSGLPENVERFAAELE